MRSFVTFTALASAASLAAATHPLFEYPAGVPALEKRQDPGTPRYACHENCGLVISLGRQDGHCQNSEWNSRYNACLECANEFGIWIYYSNGVSSAATSCGLTPVPSPSGGAAETTPAATSAPAAATTTTPAPQTTAEPEPEPEASSSAPAPPAEESTSAAGAPATTLSTHASSTASGAASASTAAAGTSAGTAVTRTTTRTSIGTSVVIPTGSPTPSTVFAGAAKNAAAMGVTFFGIVLAAF
ncbi:hypothetical protein CCHL11_07794 [Colletotrichum chlorophyti]|uniref:Uncharacterized protein n=1 Tax=Colletotrichum chlorophyti TaxID=708187 RepID=A0A1Q8RN31_9PEZI|nr:hypothetical protein CCHL11_07794 [Colletotrichum chlorophyti]